jgi:hypothetical protein
VEFVVLVVLGSALAIFEEAKPELFWGFLGRIERSLARWLAPKFAFFKQAWARDRLAALGVGSAVVAFLLWAWPSVFFPFYFSGFFSMERLPAVAAFLAVSFILLLLRRR